jgi:hypothetical protein
MRIHIELTGKTPLMMHNERLSDPDNEFTKQIKEITDKGTNQTEADKVLLSKLEWRGGIYANNDGEVIIPSPNMIRCLREAAAVTKEGRKIARGLNPYELMMPLMTGCSRRVDDLFKDPAFADKRQVKIGRGRIKRTRPIFPRWAVAGDFELLEDVLSFAGLVNIVDLAGRAVGLCDARLLGYGRFEAKITKGK